MWTRRGEDDQIPIREAMRAELDDLEKVLVNTTDINQLWDKFGTLLRGNGETYSTKPKLRKTE